MKEEKGKGIALLAYTISSAQKMRTLSSFYMVLAPMRETGAFFPGKGLVVRKAGEKKTLQFSLSLAEGGKVTI